MIGYLAGKVIENTEGRVIVTMAMGEGAVGYVVHVPRAAAYDFLAQGKSVELYVHTHVREDALDLYGFLSVMEKDLFLTLLGVSGIGPKGGLGIMSGAEPEQLVRAIIEQDKDFLTRVPGIGKKTAERVVPELSEPLRKKMEQGGFGAAMRGDAGASAKAAAAGGKAALPSGAAAVLRDAKAALVGLGYREQDIAGLLGRLMAEEQPPKRAEDLIRAALRQLA